MAFWLALAGMGLDAAGKQQGVAATLEGAEAQAGIEEMSRAAQDKRFKRDIAYQKPYFDAGEKAIDPYAKTISGEFDITQSPLYQMRKDMAAGELASAPEGVREDALKRMELGGTEQAKGGFLDLQKIGLGSAASAGQTALNFGSAYSSSLSRGSGALAQGTLSGAMQEQNIWTDVAEDISGYPAYAYQNQNLSNMNMNDKARLPSGNESAFTNYDLMY